jgi:hypothetical protein
VLKTRRHVHPSSFADPQKATSPGLRATAMLSLPVTVLSGVKI